MLKSLVTRLRHPLRSLACGLALAGVGLSGVADAKPLAISDQGRALAALLDKMDVENGWLRVGGDNPRLLVNWQTGKAEGNTNGQPDCTKRSGAKTTFCSSFVSAVVWKAGRKLRKEKLPFLHPFNADTKRYGTHGQCAPRDFLSNFQNDWLRGEAVTLPTKWAYEAPKATGWKAVPAGEQDTIMVRAQRLANEGHLVIASYKWEGTGQHAGHITVVRPAEKTREQIADEGPQVINAGWKNYTSATLKRAFINHSCGEGHRAAYCGKGPNGRPLGAWESMTSTRPRIHFFYHRLY